jgi:Tol biopolymer transport system component
LVAGRQAAGVRLRNEHLVIQVSRPQRPALFRASATSPAWSPEGRLIAYDHCHGFRHPGIDVARLDGSHVRHLTRFGCAPAWSPDGSRVAYVTRCGVRLVTAAGKDVTPNSAGDALTSASPVPPWSPDGRRIAVAGAEKSPTGTYATRGTEGLYVMNADGSGLTRIWDGWTGRPAWRPVLH